MAYIGNSPGVASQRIVTTFTATASQTTFTPSSGYTVGYLDVYHNGVKLINGDDYTASNGTTFVLASGAASGDVIEAVAYLPRGLSDGYTKAEADTRYVNASGDTMTGALVVDQTIAAGDRISVSTSDTAEITNSDPLHANTSKGFFHVANATDSSSGPEAGILMRSRTSYAGLWAIYAKRTSNYLADLIFRARNSGTTSAEFMRLDSSGHLIVPNGVTLGTSAGSYAASNTLDDYEEGTFTVTSTRDGVGQSGGSLVGKFVKVGALVHVSIYTNPYVVHNPMTHAGGQLFRITSNLPFTPTSRGGSQVAQTRTLANPDLIALCWESGSSAIYLNWTGNSNGYYPTNDVTTTNGQTNITLMWSGSYFTTA
jgi:hypothetical protein